MCKKLLNSDSLIQHMKGKGITFICTNEIDAKNFLEENNYYFKLSAYRKNYDKRLLGNNVGTYINLDFGYLQDLSKIDCQLRYLILEMCLDIEHSLKTILLKDITENPNEDGYKIVNLWDPHKEHFNKINRFLNTSYCKELINKYSKNMPVWVLLELLSFGELCKFIEFYNNTYPKRLQFDVKLLFPLRDIRNACAHSNCLIHDVRNENNSTPNHSLLKHVQSIPTISKRTRNKKLKNKPLHDFAALLYLYPIIVKSKSMLKKRRICLYNLLVKRINKTKRFYFTNIALQEAHKFILKILFINFPKKH